ncbi:unnamed protein product, partial [Cyprideis torosa]
MSHRIVIPYRKLGCLHYREAMAVMNTHAEPMIAERKAERQTSLPGILLLLQHYPVYTIGIRRRSYSDSERSRLEALGAEFHATGRGGLITFHGPGQLVAYPVLNLSLIQGRCSVRAYVSDLEDVLIKTCSSYQIQAHRSKNTGVWVQQNKIGAIGISVRHWITSHGVALNCNTNLDWFRYIVPCGIQEAGVTSLSRETGRDVSVDDALPHFLNAFEEPLHASCASVQREEKSSETSASHTGEGLKIFRSLSPFLSFALSLKNAVPSYDAIITGAE